MVAATASALAETLRGRLAGRTVEPPDPPDRLPDHLRRRDPAPRRGAAAHAARRSCDDHVGDVVSDVHLLPMFPWTSDDGFARGRPPRGQPGPRHLGRRRRARRATHARDVRLRRQPHLEPQPVVPRLAGRRPGYAGTTSSADPDFDVSHVIRPRTTPLFHPFARPDGRVGGPGRPSGRTRSTSTSATPAVLLELTDVLLGYLERGASAVRLDAIGFLWKESGTTCLHLPQTHAVIKLWRVLRRRTWRRARGCSPRRTCRTPRTSPTSATAPTRRTSSTSSRSRRWCCTRSSPARRRG